MAIITGQFINETLYSPSFQRVEGTQVFRVELPPLIGSLLDRLDHQAIISFLNQFAEEHSPRNIFKSAGMLVGRNEKGTLVMLVAANAVPFALAEKGVGGESSFEGLNQRRENATVHFEINLKLAAGKEGILADAVLYNTDPMCPNCSKYTGTFGVSHYIVGEESFNRRIFKDRMLHKGGYFDTSVPNLLRTGVSVHVVGEDGLITEYPNPYPVELAKTSIKTGYHFRELLAEFDWTDPRPAAGIITARGQMLMCRVPLPEGDQDYGGEKQDQINPLTYAMIKASGLGYDLKGSRAVIFNHVPNVNCALLCAAAGIKSLTIMGGADSLPKGAKEIFGMIGSNILDFDPRSLSHRPLLACL